MPKKPRSGPPYEMPKEVYVVVTRPWGMDTHPRNRGQDAFDRVASWAQLVLQQRGLGHGQVPTIESIYSMGTRDEIIIQFEEDTDIIPLLGEHRWANIAGKWTGPSNDPRATCVFLYNWRDNGDPATHNWTENTPENIRLDKVPAKSPYPAPSWAAPPASLVNFVLPIPRPPLQPEEPIPAQICQPMTPPPSTVAPTPAPLEPGELLQDPVHSDLFRPYEPPSHARTINQPLEQQAQSPPPKFMKKLDPYELEEDALSILHAPDPIQEDTKDVKTQDVKPALSLPIKVEPRQVKIEEVPNIPSEPVPQASSGYQPSAELAAFITAHLRGVSTAAPSSPSGSGAKSTISPRVTVKREYEEDATTLLGNRKKIKIENV